MFIKIAILACALAVCNAGLIQPASYAVASPALTSTSDNILRSPGNLAQVSTQSKTISTPFSSSSKSDIRVSNPAVYAHAAPLAYAAAPAAHYTYAAAPVAQYAHAAPAAPLGYAHAAPAAPLGYAHAAPAAPLGYAHAAPSSLLGVAYSPAVAVSHMTYSSPIGISYSY